MKKMNVRPLGENILVLPEKPEKKTNSGIYLPETANGDRPQQGKVVAIGESEKIRVKVGETVIYARYTGAEVKIDGDEYIILTHKDVLAVVE